MPSFTTLYSGSSGNCAVVQNGERFLLIDMGKNCKTTLAGLAQLGLDPAKCEGILVTHEHSDHVAGLAVFLKRYAVPVFSGADTLEHLWEAGILPPRAEAVPMEGGEQLLAGLGVTAFPTSHDVPCVGFRLAASGTAMAYASDLGCLTEPVHEALSGCSLVALEANYDLVSLRNGSYPRMLKARIESKRGHLDNRECAAKVLELQQEGVSRFALLHLSAENNSPRMALTTVLKTFRAAEITPGPEVTVQVQRRSEVSPALCF